MQYFIKRNEKINGPFTDAQIKSGIRAGKLKDADMISNSGEGPWMTLGMLSNYASRQQQEGGSVESGDSESAAEIVVEIYKDLFKGTAKILKKGMQEGIKQYQEGRTNEVAEELVGGATDLVKGMAQAIRKGVQDGIKQHQEDRTNEVAVDTESTKGPGTRNCPFCSESIAVAASKCTHCGETIALLDPSSSEGQIDQDALLAAEKLIKEQSSQYFKSSNTTEIQSALPKPKKVVSFKEFKSSRKNQLILAGVCLAIALLCLAAGEGMIGFEFACAAVFVGLIAFAGLMIRIAKNNYKNSPGLHQLANLGNPVGRSYDEILEYLGPPVSVSNFPGCYMVQWMSLLPMGHFSLMFTSDRKCRVVLYRAFC